ncbi:endonuclease/exonuclease/phosphatase family protein [Actinoplanes aureus]|uniref:Endonuclease/exonuclease/phosphatase family protein n=1 Tax=Actinoplanes aureus TaxID=2792083 RepID=A0A931CK13_9ACTN|nr:endonuclease/exonuclease/phosphatase family protein [Actinoplanes aureus]MBG0567836.1 endonuclease/exonuclease/phosphatase family protein [Actinoplanes aureus]
MTITDAPLRTRTPKRRVVLNVLVWLFLTPGLVWLLGRAFGLERGVLVMVIAFTPYVAACSLIPLLIALATKRWAAAAAAGLVAVGLAACVLPRALPDFDKGPSEGVELRVMTANLWFGTAEPAGLIRTIRDNDIAVLAVQEFTPGGEAALRAAGIAELLPHQQLAAEDGASGSGLYSRYPLTTPGSRRNDGGFMQTYATIQAPDAAPVFVESVHPLAPAHPTVLNGWSADLREQLPADPDSTPRILLGDFNATLDHRKLRDLIDTGYRDAADAVGKGLVASWGPYDGDLIPPVTIDHVLVDERIGVRDVEVFAVSRSDHRAVVASLTVPAAS